jgi:hypothetical protein
VWFFSPHGDVPRHIQVEALSFEFEKFDVVLTSIPSDGKLLQIEKSWFSHPRNF